MTVRTPAMILAEIKSVELIPLGSDKYMETFHKFVRLHALQVELAEALVEQVADAVAPVDEE
jgi:hypothetical protein